MRTKTSKTGFTLLEALMAAMLIGLAIAALAASSGAFTTYNAAGVDLSTAEFLIEEIRELTASTAFADLGDFNNQSYNPPRNADTDNDTRMTEFSTYTQNVTVTYVTSANLGTVSAAATDFRRITVTITKNGQAVTSASWIRAQY